MIPSIPQSRFVTTAYTAYVVLFFIFLALPLIVVAAFAFNDSQFPSLPGKGLPGIGSSAPNADDWRFP